MIEQKKLSLCIIAKNEESFLPRCLKNMEATADEIIVADMGSSDCTPEIARQFGAEVFKPEWENDFSKIKNFCMDHAAGKWVLFLQADETIPDEQLKELKLLLLNPAAEGYLFDVVNSGEKRTEACPAQSLRLLRNRKNYRFYYRSFEYIPDEELYSVLSSGISIIRSDNIASGWQAEERIRLLKTDIKEKPQNGYVRYLEGIELLNQGKYAESAASFERARHAFCGGYLYTPHLYKCLGASLIALSRNEAAEEALSEGFWLFPFFTDLLVLRAGLFRQQGRDAEAVKDMEICLIQRSTPSACVPEPEIDTSVIVKMLEEIRTGQEAPVNV